MNAQKKRRDVLYCCVCKTNEISPERINHGAVTCSKECAQKLRGIRRRLADRIKCRYCNAPSTPEERKAFRKWREEQGLNRKRGRPAKPAEPNGQAAFTEMIHVT